MDTRNHNRAQPGGGRFTIGRRLPTCRRGLTAHESLMKTLEYSVGRDCQSRAGWHPAPQWPRQLVSFRSCRTGRRGQSGATAIQILVILVPVLFGLIGFAVDLGRLYMVRGELKTAANAMALAAAERLIGTDQAVTDAGTAAQVPIDASTGFANKYDFGGIAIGQSTGFLSSSATPSFFTTLQDALASTGGGGGGDSTARYAQVTVTADAPLIFWRFLPLATEGKVSVQAGAVAGISTPLCTVCGIEPIAVGAVDQSDTADFGFVQGTIYTLGYSCTGAPVPAGLPYSGGATARVPYLILDRFNTADAVFPDENSQLFRSGANGMPGVNPVNGLVSNSGQPIGCFNVNNAAPEVVWADATPAICQNTVASPVSSNLCGLDTRFEASPSSSFSTVCSGIPSVGTLEPAYSQDTDVAEEVTYTSYSGNGRRLITISIVDTLTPNGGMTVLGFRQFLLQPSTNTTALTPPDMDGRFLAMYVGNVAPVKQGSFGSCGITAGPGKVVLHN